MKVTTIPVGDALPFSAERSNGIYLMRSLGDNSW